MDPGSIEWLNHAPEEPVNPDQRIIDAHHHLWPEGGALPYGLDELNADTGSGHNVVATVFMECGAAHRQHGPAHLRPVGETEFVAGQAAVSRDREGTPPIVGIVGRADLRLGPLLDEALDAHEAAGDGLFRGIRHALARAPEPEAMAIPGRAPEGLAADADFRAGVARLGARGLIYDSWHYHLQNSDFAELAAAVPDTTMVLDHFGTPIGVGSFADRRQEVFETWAESIAAVAANSNVVAKIGGLAMPDNGFGWHTGSTPPSSDEVAEAQARYYLHTIECFGPDRCMFESNFPVDRFSLSYRTMWNALMKIVADFSDEDRDQMFYRTARRVYRLDL